MDLFPKSPRDIFKKRVIVRGSDSEILESPSPKLSLQRWEQLAQNQAEDNRTALDREMEETLGQVNTFLKQLELATLVHSKRNLVKNRDWPKHHVVERQFKDQVMLGHTLRGKVKELMELEDSGLRLAKSYQTLSNNSYILIDTDGSTQGSVGNFSQSSNYSSEIRGILRKFNRVLDNPEKILTSSYLQELEVQDEIRESIVPSSSQECLQYLTERLAKDNIQLTFRTLPLKESQSHHTVTCKIFNINVEGKASEKSAAKKTAAVRLLERLVKDSVKKCLPPQISAFTEDEMKEAISVLCETEHYDSQLEELCHEYRKPRPQYFVETKYNQVQVICSALGVQGFGSGKKIVKAKRAAAWDVLLLKKKQKS